MGGTLWQPARSRESSRLRDCRCPPESSQRRFWRCQIQSHLGSGKDLGAASKGGGPVASLLWPAKRKKSTEHSLPPPFRSQRLGRNVQLVRVVTESFQVPQECSAPTINGLSLYCLGWCLISTSGSSVAAPPEHTALEGKSRIAGNTTSWTYFSVFAIYTYYLLHTSLSWHKWVLLFEVDLDMAFCDALSQDSTCSNWTVTATSVKRPSGFQGQGRKASACPHINSLCTGAPAASTRTESPRSHGSLFSSVKPQRRKPKGSESQSHRKPLGSSKRGSSLVGIRLDASR